MWNSIQRLSASEKQFSTDTLRYSHCGIRKLRENEHARYKQAAGSQSHGKIMVAN